MKVLHLLHLLSTALLTAVATGTDNKASPHLRRQKIPFANGPNGGLIATSDSDAAAADSAMAKWLFAAEGEEVELSGGPNWSVSGCCGTYEIVFLCCFAAYLLIIKLLWNTFIMKPMKLIAVFVHGKLLRKKARYFCVIILLIRNVHIH
jgi:hypothetical protein